MLNVFITNDVEVWPWHSLNRSRADLQAEVDRSIWGRVGGGEFGIGYQMRVLNANGLKGIFFVESLCASVLGSEFLRPVVRDIQSGGHDVQLHVHTEWVTHIGQEMGFGAPSLRIKNFSRQQQRKIISRAKRNLQEAGAGEITAFRAGNYGVSLETIEALRENGILYDTSYNLCYFAQACGMEPDDPVMGPMKVGGVLEVPITFFRDLPWHLRPLHLNACSFGEMRRVCMQAWRENWPSVVLVLHSFELIRPRSSAVCGPDGIAVERFEKFCRFLGENKDKFSTRLFSRLEEDPLPCTQPRRPLRTGMLCTAGRCWEQLLRRIADRGGVPHLGAVCQGVPSGDTHCG
jgi:hypothetical protein